jgi:hypothetical protein
MGLLFDPIRREALRMCVVLVLIGLICFFFGMFAGPQRCKINLSLVLGLYPRTKPNSPSCDYTRSDSFHI